MYCPGYLMSWIMVIFAAHVSLPALGSEMDRFLPKADECNGHGKLHPQNHTQLCECERPYLGEECESCRPGYYGDPRNGSPCFLGCSGNKLLFDFSTAGIGTATAGISTSTSPIITSSFCWWLIAPNLSTPDSHTDHSIHMQSTFNQLFSPSSSINISLEFLPINSSSRESSSCCSERVMVYTGIPKFLTQVFNQNQTSSSNLFLNSFTISSAASEKFSSVPELVAFYTGKQLRTAYLNVRSSIVTVLYHYDPSSVMEGFNAAVTVGEWAEQEEESGDSQLISKLSCSCLTDLCDCDSEIFATILIPSLTSLIAEQNTPLNHTPTCMGRIHHSSVYDNSSDSMFLFGGHDLSGNVCNGDMIQVNLNLMENIENIEEWEFSDSTKTGAGDVVRVINGVGSVPRGRYLHSSLLVPITEGYSDASSVLVLGGFTSKYEVSDELWQFNVVSEEWTQLSSAPSPIAAHTATLIDRDVVIVIGGVAQDLSIQASVMVYHIQQDLWERWSPSTFDLLVSVYGHTTAYHPQSQSLLVFGGVHYSHASFTLSPSLYSLHLPTRRWSIIKLQEQVLPRIFHSMVLINHQLFIHGGLIGSSDECDLGGACPSDLVTIVNLDSGNRTGRPTVSFKALLSLPGGWGHTAIANDQNQVIFAGGINGVLIDAVTVLHNTNKLCSLAQDPTQCHALLGCVSCIKTSDNSLLSCLEVQVNSSEVCLNRGGKIENISINSTINCTDFSDYYHCLSTDIARNLGCVWCTCLNISTCVNSPLDCPPCSSVNSSHQEVYPSSACEYPSCYKCLNNSNCSWTKIDSVHLPSKGYQRFSALSNQWSCFSNELMTTNSITSSRNACPLPCTTWTSCSNCIMSDSPNAGAGSCVWSSYANICVSKDAIPLLCSMGQCGTFSTTNTDCPISCSGRWSCDQCLSVPECVWKQDKGKNGTCVDVGTLEDTSAMDVHYFVCPSCADGCNGNGRCLSTLECDCDIGFIGETCGVECECNGHSYCVNESAEGKEICSQCLHNTQGPSCGECVPFSVGSALNGSRCIPCLEFCHGNTDVCMRKQELSLIGDARNKSYLLQVLSSGPSEADAVCVDCPVGVVGAHCQDCLDGYYNKATANDGTVHCAKCQCNGHSQTCDKATGVCSCENNTITISNINQCSTCINGYVGNPLHDSQCYKQQAIGVVSNFTLPFRLTTFMAVGRNLDFSNFDIYLTFVIVQGGIDIYSSTNSMAVRVVEDDKTGFHHVIIPSEVGKMSSSQTRRSTNESYHHQMTPDMSRLSKREIYSNVLSYAENSDVYHVYTDERLTLVIPHTEPNFQATQHYLTIFAREETTFYFEYAQFSPRLNYFVFFNLFFSTVTLLPNLLIVLWKFVYFLVRRRRASINEQLRQRRANRPLSSVVLCLHNRKRLKTKDKVDVSRPDIDIKECEDKTANSQPTSTRNNESSSPAERQSDLTSGNRSKLKILRRRNNKKTAEKLNLFSLQVWPVAMQPTLDEMASVHSIIVELPAKNSSRVLCVGSTLVTYSKQKENMSTQKQEIELEQHFSMEQDSSNADEIVATTQM